MQAPYSCRVYVGQSCGSDCSAPRTSTARFSGRALRTLRSRSWRSARGTPVGRRRTRGAPDRPRPRFVRRAARGRRARRRLHRAPRKAPFRVDDARPGRGQARPRGETVHARARRGRLALAEAKRRGLVLEEGYMWRHSRQTKLLEELLPQVGEIQAVHAHVLRDPSARGRRPVRARARRRSAARSRLLLLQRCASRAGRAIARLRRGVARAWGSRRAVRGAAPLRRRRRNVPVRLHRAREPTRGHGGDGVLLVPSLFSGLARRHPQRRGAPRRARRSVPAAAGRLRARRSRTAPSRSSAATS